jgi:glycosyltransferase involved in cell wall biosynthesis
MNNLSIVIPAYKNDKALKDLLTWLSMSVEQFEIIVILDGYESKINFAEFENLRVYKIKGDTKWNQPQAKNLGVHLAKNSWIYFIDIDLKPTLKSINWIRNTSLDTNTIYFP